MTKPAIIICRFSPRPVKDGDAEQLAKNEDAASIQLQLNYGTRYCEQRAFPIQEIIKLPFTSARVPFFKRPGLERLRHLPADTQLVFMDVDRFSRDIVDGFTTLNYFDQIGVGVHFTNQGNCQIDASTADGFYIIGQHLLRCEHEARKIAERTSRGMRHRQNHNNQRMTRPGYEPFGKRIDPENPANLIDNPDEIRVIELIKRLHSEGHDATVIAADLNAANIPHRSSRWSAKYVRRVVARMASS